ncbi:MAG: hypothetical protein ACOC0B_01880 [bacterium]
MKCGRFFWVWSAVFCSAFFLWASPLSALEGSDSRLSESTRERLNSSLNALARQVAEQERLLSEAGGELRQMRSLLRESRQERRRLERSLEGLQREIGSLRQSNSDSLTDLERLNTELKESETALNRLEESWTVYRRSVRRRMWIERAGAALLVGLAFALGTAF